MNGQEKGLRFLGWVVVVVLVISLFGLGIYWNRDKLFPKPKQGGGVFTEEELKKVKQAEQPDLAGITTVKEYQFIPEQTLPTVKGVSAYNPIKDSTLIVAQNVWAGWAPVFLANKGTEPNDKSVFAQKYGFKAKLMLIDNPTEMIEAFASGKIHVGWGTLDMVPLFVEQLQRDSRALPRVFMQIDWSNGGDGIVVRSSQVKTVADLKGKTIVCAQNSPSHYFGLTVLLDALVQPNDVKWKFTPDAFQAAAAFVGDRSIAACISWSPDIYRIPEKVPGTKILVTTATANRTIADVLFARADFARDNPKLIEGFVRGIFDGMEMMKSDAGKKEAAEIMAKAYKISKDEALAMLGDAHNTNYAETRDFFLNVNNPTNFERLWEDASFKYFKIGRIKNIIKFDQVMDFTVIKALSNVEPYASSKSEYDVAFTPKAASSIKAESEEILTRIERIHFYPNSWDLFYKTTEGAFYDPNVNKVIEEVGKLSGRFGAARIVIEGHTDASMKGKVPAAAVKELALNRANAVKMELVKRFGLKADQFSIEGMGWDRPVDEANHALNRRVEIKVYPLEATK